MFPVWLLEGVIVDEGITSEVVELPPVDTVVVDTVAHPEVVDEASLLTSLAY